MLAQALPLADAAFAQASGGQQDALRSALVWAGVLGALVVVLGVVMLVLRARTLGRDRDAGEAGVFENLRRMRERGEITPEEYEQARRSMADRLRGEARTRVRGVSIPPAEARVVTRGQEGEEVRAKPGYDLTGMPLPGAAPPPPTGGARGGDGAPAGP